MEADIDQLLSRGETISIGGRGGAGGAFSKATFYFTIILLHYATILLLVRWPSPTLYYIPLRTLHIPLNYATISTYTLYNIILLHRNQTPQHNTSTAPLHH